MSAPKNNRALTVTKRCLLNRAGFPDVSLQGPVISLLLVLAVFIVYAGTFNHDFVNFDDDQYVYANPIVVNGLTLSGIRWAFIQSHSTNWHPLTWISHMLDCELFTLQPGGHHFTNVLFHALNSLLLFQLLRRMTGALWKSALVAALFALHPLHVESVAWVSERKDVLSACFGLLALISYEKYAQGAGVRNVWAKSRDYWLALLLFALGLLCKPMLVTLPLVMLVLDYWPLNRIPARSSDFHGRALFRLVSEKLPFLTLSASSSIVTYLVQSHSGAVHSFLEIPMLPRITNAVVSYVRYLKKMCWPVDLALPYPHPGFWSWLHVVLAFLILAVITTGVFRRARTSPYLVTGWLWYLVMLLPVIGMIQVGVQSMADRYTYVPLVGVFIMLVWGADQILARWAAPRWTILLCVSVILGALVLRTVHQLRYWRNTETLFRHAIQVTKRNYVASYNLASYLQDVGRNDEAIQFYRKALEFWPSYDDALNNLGVALGMKGELDAAQDSIRQAIQLRPNKADAHYNFGNVLVMQKRFDEAISAYTEAVRLKPDYPEAHNNLAGALATQGRFDEASRHYRETLRLRPDHAEARRQLQRLEDR